MVSGEGVPHAVIDDARRATVLSNGRGGIGAA